MYIHVRIYTYTFKRNYTDAKDVPANDIESSFRPFESVPNQIVSEIREKFVRRQKKEVTERIAEFVLKKERKKERETS